MSPMIGLVIHYLLDVALTDVLTNTPQLPPL